MLPQLKAAAVGEVVQSLSGSSLDISCMYRRRSINGELEGCFNMQ